MLSFMFGVLGSNLFWVCYTIASFMAAVVIMRHFRPNEYAALLGKKTDSKGKSVKSGVFNTAMGTLLTLLILWPAVAFVYTVMQFFKVIMFKLAGGIVHKAFVAIDKLTPEVSITFNKKEDK